MFKTISNDSEAEIIEKKSKFIANIFYVETREEAEEKIKEIKKKYFDARHNCFAYSIFTKDRIIERFSDDGEPSGTAGAPMLNILSSQNLRNVVVIVTRYFGGILLGTGGLVRAYTGAVQEALKNVEIIEKYLGLEVNLEVNYPNLEKLKYYLKQNEIKILSSEYLENIKVLVEISEEKLENLLESKNELNFNLINVEKVKEKYLPVMRKAAFMRSLITKTVNLPVRRNII
ncbi:MAG TPA: YigZ family protein [Candidatus Scatovivens faecipullorum]|nr:YigZ family protein [Candidatus Scatovivens faecipullorum]